DAAALQIAGDDRVLKNERAAGDIKTATDPKIIVVIIASVASHGDTCQRRRSGGTGIRDTAAVVVRVIVADSTVRDRNSRIASGADVEDTSAIRCRAVIVNCAAANGEHSCRRGSV